MKKQLLKNTLVAIVALFITIIALPTTAQAQVQTMKILGEDYYQDAVVNIGGGTATWDQANATLTLDGINVESHKEFFIYCENIPNLKIVLAGNIRDATKLHGYEEVVDHLMNIERVFNK